MVSLSLKYIAADAWTDKCGATRQAGESCLAVIHLVEKLQQNLALLGVPVHVGQSRNAATGSSSCLDPTKQQRWIAAANDSADVSDDVIHALETAAAGATVASMGVDGTSVPEFVCVGGGARRLVWPLPRALDNIP